MVVIVVRRKVGGQQSALRARDWIPTLSWKENHNNHRLTPISYIRKTAHSAGESYNVDKLFASLPAKMPIYLSICLLIKAFFFFFNTCPPTILPGFFISLILFVCLSSAETETNPSDTIYFHSAMKQPFPTPVHMVS